MIGRLRWFAPWLDAPRASFRGTTWVLPCIVGTLLAAIPLVNVLVIGYAGLAYRSVLRGGELGHWPGWREWKLALRAALWLASIALATVLAGALIGLAFSPFDDVQGAFPNPYVWVLLTFAGAVLFPLMAARAYLRGTLAAAFHIRAIWRWFGTHVEEYLPHWIAGGFLVTGAGLVQAASLSSLSAEWSRWLLLRHLLVSFVAFIVLMLVCRALGSVVARHGKELGDGTAQEA